MSEDLQFRPLTYGRLGDLVWPAKHLNLSSPCSAFFFLYPRGKSRTVTLLGIFPGGGNISCSVRPSKVDADGAEKTPSPDAFLLGIRNQIRRLPYPRAGAVPPQQQLRRLSWPLRTVVSVFASARSRNALGGEAHASGVDSAV